MAPANRRVTHARSTPAATRRRTDPLARREHGAGDAQRTLDTLMDRYDPAIAGIARDALAKLSARWPDAVQALIAHALAQAKPVRNANAGRLIIKSISAKQRPRRVPRRATSKAKT